MSDSAGVTWGTLIQAALLLFAGLAVLLFATGIDYDQLWSSLEDATWGWILFGFFVAQPPRLTQATATLGSVAPDLRFGPVYVMQLATSYMNLALPSSAARLAVNIRFFQRQGLTAAGRRHRGRDRLLREHGRAGRPPHSAPSLHGGEPGPAIQRPDRRLTRDHRRHRRPARSQHRNGRARRPVPATDRRLGAPLLAGGARRSLHASLVEQDRASPRRQPRHRDPLRDGARPVCARPRHAGQPRRSARAQHRDLVDQHGHPDSRRHRHLGARPHRRSRFRRDDGRGRLAAVLLYRVSTFYLPPTWGFFAMRYLQRNRYL